MSPLQVLYKIFPTEKVTFTKGDLFNLEQSCKGIFFSNHSHVSKWEYNFSIIMLCYMYFWGIGVCILVLLSIIQTIVGIILLLGRYELQYQPKSSLSMRQIASPSKTD